MLVDIPIVHGATVVPKRRRKAEQGVFTHVATVAIDELGSDDCPVAFWLPHPGDVPDLQAAWRRRDGDFLMPMAGGAPSPTAMRVSPSSRRRNAPQPGAVGSDDVPALFRNVVFGRDPDARSIATHPGTTGRRHDGPLPPSLEEADPTRIEACDRDATTSAVVEAFARRYVLVDGILHLRGGPPMVVLDGYSSKIRVGGVDAASLGSRASVRYAGALRSTRDVRNAAGKDREPPASLARNLFCEIVDEEAAEFDEARHLLLVAARDLVRSASVRNDRYGSAISNASRDAMVAFVRLRDMEAGDLSTNELFDAVGEFVRTADRISHHLHPDRIGTLLRTADDLIASTPARRRTP